MKPYKVKVIYETVIAAASEKEAMNEAEYLLKESDELAKEVIVDRIKTVDTTLPTGWKYNCVPWGSTKERTINDLMKPKTL